MISSPESTSVKNENHSKTSPPQLQEDQRDQTLTIKPKKKLQFTEAPQEESNEEEIQQSELLLSFVALKTVISQSNDTLKIPLFLNDENTNLYSNNNTNNTKAGVCRHEFVLSTKLKRMGTNAEINVIAIDHPEKNRIEFLDKDKNLPLGAIAYSLRDGHILIMRYETHHKDLMEVIVEASFRKSLEQGKRGRVNIQTNNEAELLIAFRKGLRVNEEAKYNFPFGEYAKDKFTKLYREYFANKDNEQEAANIRAKIIKLLGEDNIKHMQELACENLREDKEFDVEKDFGILLEYGSYYDTNIRLEKKFNDPIAEVLLPQQKTMHFADDTAVQNAIKYYQISDDEIRDGLKRAITANELLYSNRQLGQIALEQELEELRQNIATLESDIKIGLPSSTVEKIFDQLTFKFVGMNILLSDVEPILNELQGKLIETKDGNRYLRKKMEFEKKSFEENQENDNRSIDDKIDSYIRSAVGADAFLKLKQFKQKLSELLNLYESLKIICDNNIKKILDIGETEQKNNNQAIVTAMEDSSKTEVNDTRNLESTDILGQKLQIVQQKVETQKVILLEKEREQVLLLNIVTHMEDSSKIEVTDTGNLESTDILGQKLQFVQQKIETQRLTSHEKEREKVLLLRQREALTKQMARTISQEKLVKFQAHINDAIEKIKQFLDTLQKTEKAYSEQEKARRQLKFGHSANRSHNEDDSETDSSSTTSNDDANHDATTASVSLFQNNNNKGKGKTPKLTDSSSSSSGEEKDYPNYPNNQGGSYSQNNSNDRTVFDLWQKIKNGSSLSPVQFIYMMKPKLDNYPDLFKNRFAKHSVKEILFVLELMDKCLCKLGQYVDAYVAYTSTATTLIHNHTQAGRDRAKMMKTNWLHREWHLVLDSFLHNLQDFFKTKKENATEEEITDIFIKVLDQQLIMHAKLSLAHMQGGNWHPHSFRTYFSAYISEMESLKKQITDGKQPLFETQLSVDLIELAGEDKSEARRKAKENACDLSSLNKKILLVLPSRYLTSTSQDYVAQFLAHDKRPINLLYLFNNISASEQELTPDKIKYLHDNVEIHFVGNEGIHTFDDFKDFYEYIKPFINVKNVFFAMSKDKKSKTTSNDLTNGYKTLETSFERENIKVFNKPTSKWSWFKNEPAPQINQALDLKDVLYDPMALNERNIQALNYKNDTNDNDSDSSSKSYDHSSRSSY